MQATFLLGPAGSGKTWRCLSEIRAALHESPDGPPLVLLAPKQATYQLERQLLADETLAGYTRLHILSFERLAEFVFDRLGRPLPELLAEQGRVMVLRALLGQKHGDLKVFRASARLPGFADQLSLLLRELQRHKLSTTRLRELSEKPDLPAPLRDKLHDIGLLLDAYLDWLKAHRLEDADRLLDLAADALHSANRKPQTAIQIAGLWLDGFAEMTPQEVALLTAVMPCCERATLAFCLGCEPQAEASWLSPWAVVGQTFRRCSAALSALPGVNVSVQVLPRTPKRSRFAGSVALRHLEEFWSQPKPFTPAAARNADLASSIRLVACPNAEAEAIVAAREILRHVRAGGRFRDCAVIVRSLDGYHDTLRRVFTRYDIPFFLDRREPVAHHPLAELTRCALRTVAFGWKHDDWFGALKTGLVPVQDQELDVLENLALEFGWEGRTWLQPLELPEHKHLAESAERLRQQLVPPFTDLAGQDAAPLTGGQLADRFRRLWAALNVQATLEKWSYAADKSPLANRRSQIHTTVWEQMNAWLDNLALAFPREVLPLHQWLPILEAGLSTLTVGVIPPALDQVLIGTVDRSRNPDLQLVLVLGVNEGVFPAPPPSEPLLNDTERDLLALQGGDLGPGPRHRLGHERYFGYIACTRASERLVLMCAQFDAKGRKLNRSPFFDHLGKLVPELEVEVWQPPAGFAEAEHVSEIIVPAIQLQNSPLAAQAKELLALPELTPVLLKARQIAGAASAQRLSPAVAEALYGRELATSVSALEDFAECPFKFFVGHGLNADERKRFELDARERGSFQHEVLAAFHRQLVVQGKKWRDLSPAEARGLIRQLGEEQTAAFRDGLFLASQSGRFTARSLIEGMEQLIETLIGWAPQYQFEPHAVEVSFGLEDSRLPAWQLDLGDGHALVLRGRIDRVDLCRVPDTDTALAVIVDYKSSGHEFDATRLHHGLELQLLAYLGALSHLADPRREFNVARLLPAGVFYVSLKGSSKPGRNRVEAREDPQELRVEGYQHRGRFDGDRLDQFDRRNEAKGTQFRFSKNQDGSFSKKGNEAMPAAEFRALLKQIEDFLHRYGQAIYAGDAHVSPFRKGKETACDWCDYRPICRFDPWTEPYRVLRPPPKPAEAVVVGKTSAKRKS